MREWRRRAGGSVGLVPTMGALHEGHLSLVRRSVFENDRTVASLFVNPAQFDDPRDLAAYPRDPKSDAAKLLEAGCDVLYAPSADALYPPSFQCWVEVGSIAEPLEGAARPGHFRGIATVVLKLLQQTQPERAYFGAKDFQQVAVVSTMVRDLDVPVEIVRCPTVREPDGLAMSSRNRRLRGDERAAATSLYRALLVGARLLTEGERDPAKIRQRLADVIESEPLVKLEYASVAKPDTLEELDGEASLSSVLLSLAASVGEVRLIDNLLLDGATKRSE